MGMGAAELVSSCMSTSYRKRNLQGPEFRAEL
jgi:hypothetical protein